MSTRSVGRSMATHQTSRSAAKPENGRRASVRGNGRATAASQMEHSSATPGVGRSSATAPEDCFSRCSFSFADGRRCRMLRRDGHPYLCAFHARRESQALAGDKAGGDIAYHLSGGDVSDFDLSSALGRLFAAVAQGQVQPKTAATLTYLGRLLAQTARPACPAAPGNPAPVAATF